MNEKTAQIGIGVFLLIIGGLFYLMNMYTPICGDDYLYSFYLTPVAAKSFFEGASIGFEQKISSFADVMFSQYNHYFYVHNTLFSSFSLKIVKDKSSLLHINFKIR